MIIPPRLPVALPPNLEFSLVAIASTGLDPITGNPAIAEVRQAVKAYAWMADDDGEVNQQPGVNTGSIYLEGYTTAPKVIKLPYQEKLPATLQLQGKVQRGEINFLPVMVHFQDTVNRGIGTYFRAMFVSIGG